MKLQREDGELILTIKGEYNSTFRDFDISDESLERLTQILWSTYNSGRQAKAAEVREVLGGVT